MFPRHSSIPARQFWGLIILLFCLLASLVCEPDVSQYELFCTNSGDDEERNCSSPKAFVTLSAAFIITLIDQINKYMSGLDI